jgi:hypothetical protein
MKIDIIYLQDCPNVRVVRQRLAAALAATGHCAAQVRLLRAEDLTPAQAQMFPGSPTILIDDVDPFAATASPANVSCRLYQTPTGLAGCPSVEQLIDALTETAATAGCCSPRTPMRTPSRHRRASG